MEQDEHFVSDCVIEFVAFFSRFQWNCACCWNVLFELYDILFFQSLFHFHFSSLSLSLFHYFCLALASHCTCKAWIVYTFFFLVLLCDAFFFRSATTLCIQFNGFHIAQMLGRCELLVLPIRFESPRIDRYKKEQK